MHFKSASICLVAIIFIAPPAAEARLFGGNKPQIRPARTTGELTPRAETNRPQPPGGKQNWTGEPGVESFEAKGEQSGLEPGDQDLAGTGAQNGKQYGDPTSTQSGENRSSQANEQPNGRPNRRPNRRSGEQNDGQNHADPNRRRQTEVAPLKRPVNLDRSQMFTYDLPEGWQCVQNPFCDHDILTQSASGDKTRSICTTTYHPHFPKNKVKEEFEKILSKKFDECKVTRSEVVKLACGKSAARIEIVGKFQAMGVRQTTFVIPMAHGVYLTMQETGPVEDGEKPTQDFLSLIDSFKPAR